MGEWDKRMTQAGGQQGQRALSDEWGSPRNGVAVRAQLRQNAAFKAQMMARRGLVVQREEFAKRSDWADGEKKTLRIGQIDDPATVCAILRFVWPEKEIPERVCSDAETKALAVNVANRLIFGGGFLAVVPRPAVPTPGYLLDQLKGVVTRATGDIDAYKLSITGVRMGLTTALNDCIGAATSGAYTNKRGLGF